MHSTKCSRAARSTPPKPKPLSRKFSTTSYPTSWSRESWSRSSSRANLPPNSRAAHVMERFGIKIDLDPAGLKRCLERAGFCFIFAPAYHPVLARLAVLRRTLGTRTMFNLIAPLSNPARPKRQLMGVAEPRLLRPMAEALAALGVEHAMVVHGKDGLDEISLAMSTSVVEVRRSEIREFEITPEQFGITPGNPAELLTGDAGEATEVLRRALAGDTGAAQDVLALNAGAAIYVGGGAASMAEGVKAAFATLASGRALETIERIRLVSNEGAEVRR